MNGDEAFDLVQKYSNFGIHRTGTKVDAQTTDWLEQELSRRGADVLRQPYEFNRFNWTVVVRANGEAVEAMPLYYSAIGRYALEQPAVGLIDADANETAIAAELHRLVAQARTDGCDGLVLATQCHTGALCAINRGEGDGFELPVVLVPGNALSRIRGAPLTVQFEANLTRTRSANLIVRFAGPSRTRPAIVTTPISGWFTCAGERGCGIAVAIHAAERLSKQGLTYLLLASGHEVDYVGGHHLARDFEKDPACILHIGSCIATREAEMVSICSVPESAFQPISAAVEPMGIRPQIPENPLDAASWYGESTCWASRNRPMLSVAGQSPQFHTSGDVPEAVTSANLLETSLNAVAGAAEALFEGSV